MKKPMFAFATIALAGSLVAVEAQKPAPRQLTPEEMKAQRAERRIKAMNETGGFIADTREASGRFVFVNAQKSVPAEVIALGANRCQNSCMVLTSVVEGEKVCCKTAEAAFHKLNANMAAFIIDEEGLPMSVQCPEGRWALINVAALKKDGPSDEVLASRVRKMMGRTLAMMFQCGYSVSPMSTVQPITTPAELDKMKSEGVATDCQTVVQQVAAKFGFKPMKRIFYRKALEEGWAPEPVTEIQKNCKKIWEQERKGEPSSPLKIKFDKKSGGQVK